MKITVTFDSLEEFDAFRGVSSAKEPPVKSPEDIPVAAPVSSASEQVIAPETPAVSPTAPTPEAVPVAPTPEAVPVAPAQSYSLDDLAKAGIALMDQGKQADLLTLLQQFGVTALPQIPKEQYGAVATAMRGLGAQI